MCSCSAVIVTSGSNKQRCKVLTKILLRDTRRFVDCRRQRNLKSFLKLLVCLQYRILCNRMGLRELPSRIDEKRDHEIENKRGENRFPYGAKGVEVLLGQDDD